MKKHSSFTVGISFLLFSQQLFALQAAVWNRYSGFDNAERMVADDLSSVFRCAIQESGYKISLSLIPINRQVQMMRKGLLDIGVAWIQTEEHDSFGVMAKPVSHVQLILLTSRPFSDDHFFHDIKLATTLKAGVVEMIDGLRAKTEYVKSFSSAALMASLNRVDGAIVPKHSLEFMDNNLRTNLYQKEVGDIPLSFYVSKKTKGFKTILKGLNKGIDACLQRSEQF